MNTRTQSRRRGRGKRWNPRFAALVLALVCVAAGVAVWLHGTLLGLPGEDIETPSYVRKDYLTVNEWSRPGTPLEEIHGVVIHYVGNPGTTAEANRNYFESLSSGDEGVYASSHFIVGLEGGGAPVHPFDGDRLCLQLPQRRYRLHRGLPSR